MIDWEKDERSYLLAKAAKHAWEVSGGVPDDAVAILDRLLKDDRDLREHIAVIAIGSIITHETEKRIGPAAGRA